MKRISARFSSGNLPPNLCAVLGEGVPTDLKHVARTFLNLQEARYKADYALAKHVTREEAARLLKQAEKAFAAWERVRKSPEARVYLIALLLGGRWAR